MIIGIPTELQQNEKRVAATPETIQKYVKAGFQVIVQRGAGAGASILDPNYESAGASLAADGREVYQRADLVLKVQPPSDQELALFRKESVLISFLQPLTQLKLIQSLASTGCSAFAMEMVPRIARAQKCDALSSQSNVSGYKAVLLAANRIQKLFPLMMTAAGTIQPAKVLVLGAGVAGLQAIATAKRLGAKVEAFDTRPVVKEQVESLGGKFLELDLIAKDIEDKGGYAKELSQDDHQRELDLIAKHAMEADVVISTALIPGRPAPVLITEETVKKMKQGSVIVDLAAEAGGNCPLTQKDTETIQHGVTLIGYTNLPSMMADEASKLYARNVMNLVFEIWVKDRLDLDQDNEIVREALVTRDGKVVHPRLQQAKTEVKR